jgi:hypothetical protein
MRNAHIPPLEDLFDRLARCIPTDILCGDPIKSRNRGVRVHIVGYRREEIGRTTSLGVEEEGKEKMALFSTKG